MINPRDSGAWRPPGLSYLRTKGRKTSTETQAPISSAALASRSECYNALLSIPHNRNTREAGLASSANAFEDAQFQRATLSQSPQDRFAPIEELCWQGSTMVWSTGSRIEHTFDFKEEGQDIVQALFAFFDEPQDILQTAAGNVAWLAGDPGGRSATGHERLGEEQAATSSGSGRQGSSMESARPTRSTQAVCVFFRDRLIVHYSHGEEYLLHLPWTLKRAWTAQSGIICETVQPLSPGTQRDGLGISERSIHLWVLTDPASYQFRPLFATRELSLPSPLLSCENWASDSSKSADSQHVRPEDRFGTASSSVSTVDHNKSLIYCTDAAEPTFPIVLFGLERSTDIHICTYARVLRPTHPTAASSAEGAGPPVVTAPPSPVSHLRRSARVQRKHSSASQNGLLSLGLQRGNALASMPKSYEGPFGLTADGRFSPDDDSAHRRRASIAMSRRASSRGVSLGGTSARDEYGPFGFSGNIGGNLANRAMMHTEQDDDYSLAYDPAALLEDLGDGEMTVQTVKVLQAAEIGTLDSSPEPATAAVYDVRGGSACLALCFSNTSTSYLLGLKRTPSTVEVTTLRAITATHVVPVLCTRPGVYDLLALRPNGEATILSTEGVPDVKVPKSSTQKTKDIQSHGCDSLAVAIPSRWRLGSTTRIWRFDLWSRDATVQLFLELVAARLHTTLFGQLLQCFLEIHNIVGDDDKDSDLHALCRLLHSFSYPPPADESAPAIGVDNAWHLVSAGSWALGLDPALACVGEDIATGATSPSAWDFKRRRSSVTSNEQIRTAMSDALRAVLCDFSSSNTSGQAKQRLRAFLLGYRIFLPHLANPTSHPNPTLSANPQAVFLSDDFANSCTVTHAADRVMRQVGERHSHDEAQSGPPASFYGRTAPSRSEEVLSLMHLLCDDGLPNQQALLARQMAHWGWTRKTMTDLPFGLSLPLRESLRACQFEPPSECKAAVYRLIGRPDLAQIRQGRQSDTYSLTKRSAHWNHREDTEAPPKVPSGDAPSIVLCCSADATAPRASSQVAHEGRQPASRFSDDLRSIEVARMLNYSSELRLRLSNGTESGPHAQAAEHAALIAYYARRTMALPYGSAAFAYKSSHAVVLPIPLIKCNVRSDPEGAILPADPTRLEGIAWPRFHAGVASALELGDVHRDSEASPSTSIDRPEELDDRHAGYLLGLGLSGRLRAFTRMQIFRYLDPKHEMTSIAILLGLPATFLGTEDPKVASILAAHVSALYPEQATHLNVSPLTQCAALVGFGLLHVGTGHRRVAESMLRELLRAERITIDAPESNRETYCLSAAIGYGFVMLGRGGTLSKEVRADLTRTFKHLMHGDATRPLPGVNEGPGSIDTTVTSSAATISLAMVYLKTHRKEAAELCHLPCTRRRLDAARPLALLLRTCARCLIMWDSIDVSPEWVETQVPPFILQTVDKGDSTVDIAYWNTIAGACLAMGLRYAGSARAEAHSTLVNLYDRAMCLASSSATSIQAKLRRHSIRMCSSVMLLALSVVMAGTGELQVLRRLRIAHGTVGEAIGHGNHVATHLAVGFLFLGKGKYSFGTSDVAVAALLCALYPLFPGSSEDHGHHLQPLRHLWTLAAEPRCVTARDVDEGGIPVFLPLKIKIKEQSPTSPGLQPRSKALIAPTLLPPASCLVSLKLDSPRYWPLSLRLDLADRHLRPRLPTQALWVKRKVGHLDYFRDPRGVQSIATRGRATEGAANVGVDDLGRIARISRTALPPQPQRRGQSLELVSNLEVAPSIAALVALLPVVHRNERYGSSDVDFSTFIASVLVQTLIQDKLDVVPLYLACFWVATAPWSNALLTSQEQLLFLAGAYRASAVVQRQPYRDRTQPPLVDSAVVTYAHERLANCYSRWLQNNGQDIVQKYLRDRQIPFGKTDALLLAGTLAFHRLPDLACLDLLREFVRHTITEASHASEADVAEALRDIFSALSVSNRELQDALVQAA